ncbi:MAG: DUF1572 family protein [Ignavibacteriae bacterium]|nr:DUF1572 family protein [Ignavibacteriota bacterium]
MNIESTFATYSISLLKGEYLPRIHACVDQLTDEQIWWRPNEASNSIGNLILHLTGNVTQWIVNSIGGVPYTRDRAREFAERNVISRDELLSALDKAMDAAEEIILNLDPARFAEVKVIQGNTTSVFEAIYHVVEHFSMHTGQILLMTKMLNAKDLDFDDFPGAGMRPR